MERLRPHPALGWISCEHPPMSEILMQHVSREEVRTARKKIEQRSAEQVPDIIKQLFGPNVAILTNQDDIDDDELKKFMEEKRCSFEIGIVVEVGMTESMGDQLGFAVGNRIFYHQGDGHMIGELRFLQFSDVIAWD